MRTGAPMPLSQDRANTPASLPDGHLTYAQVNVHMLRRAHETPRLTATPPVLLYSISVHNIRLSRDLVVVLSWASLLDAGRTR